MAIYSRISSWWTPGNSLKLAHLVENSDIWLLLKSKRCAYIPFWYVVSNFLVLSLIFVLELSLTMYLKGFPWVFRILPIIRRSPVKHLYSYGLRFSELRRRWIRFSVFLSFRGEGGSTIFPYSKWGQTKLLKIWWEFLLPNCSKLSVHDSVEGQFCRI